MIFLVLCKRKITQSDKLQLKLMVKRTAARNFFLIPSTFSKNAQISGSEFIFDLA